jgi:squalene-hopene/tetraprenyl-beta-curcumene cyclase
MKATLLGICLLAGCVFVGLPATRSSTETQAAHSWNQKAAASYLDYREGWWAAWPKAARDHQTFCISCHTAVPYAISRRALRGGLGETDTSPNERALLANVTKRVRLWKEVEPFYTDATYGSNKGIESRGTEAVLSALILATHAAQRSMFNSSSDAHTAFDNMWALQLTTGDAKGAWPWLRFGNEPWEADDSQFYGAALAAVAVGTAPPSYRAEPAIQNNLKQLREYFEREFARQSLHNRVVLLWASAKWTDLLKTEERKSIIKEILDQQQADGGWSLSSLIVAWKRADGTPQEVKSDGYATGLVSFTLEQAGFPKDDNRLQKALLWLIQNQDAKDGRWLAYSLNKQRDLTSDRGSFMSDAATAYSVLALTQAESH